MLLSIREKQVQISMAVVEDAFEDVISGADEEDREAMNRAREDLFHLLLTGRVHKQ